MQAVIFDQHGDVDVLQYRAVPTPEPSRGQALVQLRAAALNRAGILVRQGAAHFNTPLPLILGIEGAGVVAQLGADVDGVRVGERVVIDPHFNCGRCHFCRIGRENLCLDYRVPGEHINGTYAEYIAVPAENLIPVPKAVSFEHAAAAPVAFLTAWHLLITRGRLCAGENILIVGAGGGVASAAVQIAHMAGARVIATTGSVEKARHLRELGAAEVINYRETPDFDRIVLELTDGMGVDVVQDNVGHATFQKCLNSLAKGGRFLGVGSHTGTEIHARLWQIYSRELQIIGSHQGTHAELRTVLALVWSGRLHPVVDRSFQLSDARAAHRHMLSGERFGKVILTIA